MFLPLATLAHPQAIPILLFDDWILFDDILILYISVFYFGFDVEFYMLIYIQYAQN